MTRTQQGLDTNRSTGILRWKNLRGIGTSVRFERFDDKPDTEYPTAFPSDSLSLDPNLTKQGNVAQNLAPWDFERNRDFSTTTGRCGSIKTTSWPPEQDDQRDFARLGGASY